MMDEDHRRDDHGCDRARAWASLELDGELSQLESALLAAHVRRCASCAAAIAEMRAVATLLRAAPPEAPSRPLTIAAAASRRRPLAVRLALAATLAALAASLGVLAGSYGGDSPRPAPPVEGDIALLPTQDEERDDSRRLRPQPGGPLVQPLAPAAGRGRGV
jgi:ferric-dicitrate binding protein FerR (iron transport regulator)